MDLPWFCWQKSKVSIRHECWRSSFNHRSISSLCNVYIRFVLCCAFRMTQFPNIQIGNVGLLFSNRVFSAQKGAYARLTRLLREMGGGSCCHSCFPPKLWRGGGMFCEAWQRQHAEQWHHSPESCRLPSALFSPSPPCWSFASAAQTPPCC